MPAGSSAGWREHPVGVQHALRRPGRPGGEQILATASGFSPANARLDGRAGHGGHQLAQPGRSRPVALAHDGGHRGQRVQGRAEPPASSANTAPGLISSAIARIRA